MAGLPWIRVEVIVPNHPKVQRLEKELDVEDGLGMLVRLWAWTASYYPSGEFPDESQNVMAEVVAGPLGMGATQGMTGRDATIDVTDVTPALVTVGLLERIPGGYRVHDWDDFQTAHIERDEKLRTQNAKRQADLRARRKALRVTRDVTVTCNGPSRPRGEERRGEESRHDPAIPINGTGLAGFREKLATRLGRGPEPLPFGDDAPEVAAFFLQQLSAVGEDVLLNDCVESARRSTTGTPATLGWFVGWLKNLPTSGAKA